MKNNRRWRKREAPHPTIASNDTRSIHQLTTFKYLPRRQIKMIERSSQMVDGRCARLKNAVMQCFGAASDTKQEWDPESLGRSEGARTQLHMVLLWSTARVTCESLSEKGSVPERDERLSKTRTVTCSKRPVELLRELVQTQSTPRDSLFFFR